MVLPLFMVHYLIHLSTHLWRNQPKCKFSFYWQKQCWIPASNFFFEQHLEETHFITNCFVLDQQKKRKMFWTRTKLQWGGKEAWPKCWNDEQSPCANPSSPSHPHHSVFVPLTWKVWQPKIKRDKSWLQFFALESIGCFFWETTAARSEGWMDGWMERNHNTLLHLRHWWKPEGCLETGARTASGCHGNQCTWRAERTQTSLPLPRFERARIDTSAWPKGKGWERGKLSCLHPSTPLYSWRCYFYLHRVTREKKGDLE